MSGGTDAITYLFSGSYSRENGIFKESDTNFKTYSLLGRLDAQVNKNIKIGIDINARYNDHYDEGDAFSELAFVLPIDPPYWPNGMPSSGIEYGRTPVTIATSRSGWTTRKHQRFSTKGSFDIKVPWIDGFGFDGYVFFSQNGLQTKQWFTPFTSASYNRATEEYSIVNSSPTDPRLTENRSDDRSVLINLRAKYERQFNDHKLNAFVAVEQSEANSNNIQAFRRDYLSTALPQLFAGSLTGLTNDGSSSESARQNLFGRVSYDFQGKYMIDINLRYDGSSNFPKENRWGFFPGGSAAWRISEEDFMKNKFSFIDHLKLRASYGELGNDAVPAFQWMSTYTIGNTGYPFGKSPVMTSGLVAGVTPNSNITWEVAQISNIGLDGRLWRGLLGFELDLFKQKRSNILATKSLAVPKFTGLKLPNENIGVVENKGIELQLSHYNTVSKDFSFRIEGNIAYAKNKVIDISEASGIPEWQKAEGHSIGAERYYIAKGIFRTQEQLDSTPHVPGTVLGDLIYEDFTKDGLISEGDMKRLDKTNTPEITFGSTITIDYKRFSAWVKFTGQTRAWQYFHKHSKGAGHNSLKELLENRYTPGSMDSKYPNIPDSEVQGMDISGYASTFWLLDASFLRLKTLQISYTFPQNLINKVNIGSMMIYINGSNLFTIDKIKWVDPEGAQWMGRFYPQNKIYNLGVNVTF